MWKWIEKNLDRILIVIVIIDLVATLILASRIYLRSGVIV